MTDPNPAAWEPCRSGELARVSSRLRYRHKLQVILTTTAVALGAAAGTGLAGWAVYSAVAPSARPGSTPCHLPTDTPTTCPTGGDAPVVCADTK
jgi:hypothetical protein